MNTLLDIGNIFYCLGAFYGLLMQQIDTPGIIWGTLEDDSFLKMVARFLVSITLIIPYAFISKSMVLPNVVTQANSYSMFLIGRIIPNILYGVSLFYMADMLNVKLGILKVAKQK